MDFNGKINQIKKRFHLRFDTGKLEVHVVDHCNLNCRCCSHYSPVSEPWFLTPEDLSKNLSLLSPKGAALFKDIRLLGGEPLMNPELISIMKIVREKFRTQNISVVTNGILLNSMPEEFWDACREFNIGIHFSYYPINVDYDQLALLIARNGLVPYVHGNHQKSGFRHELLDEKGKQNKWKSYYNCSFGGSCLQLRGDKIFSCAEMAYIDVINKAFDTKFSYKKHDYIIVDRLNSKWQIIFYKLFPRPFCRYCCTSEIKVEDWAHSAKKREEWLR